MEYKLYTWRKVRSVTRGPTRAGGPDRGPVMTAAPLQRGRLPWTSGASPPAWVRAGEAGTTLVELMATTAISLVALLGITSTFVTQSQSYLVEGQKVGMQQTARTVAALMTQDLNLAGYNPTRGATLLPPPSCPTYGATLNGVTYTPPTQLWLLADLNNDGCLTGPNEPNEIISYSYNAAAMQLTRGTQVPPSSLVFQNIQAWTLLCLDSSGNQTTIPADISQVQVFLTVRAAQPDPSYPLNNGYRTYTVQFSVTPRNLGL